MRKARPAITGEFREKVERLQREHPLAGDVGARIGKATGEALGRTIDS